MADGQWAPAHTRPVALASALERGGHRVGRLRRPPFGANQLWMWQTLMNAITLHASALSPVEQ